MIALCAEKVKPAFPIPFQFRAEPVGLRESRKVSGSAVALFTAILDDAKRRGWRCRLSNAALAERIGRTTMTVKRLLAELEAADMVARDMIAGGRVRLAIVVTWEGVEHSRSTDVRPVEHPRSGGGTSPTQGVEHSRSTIQSVPQTQIQTAPILPPLGEDPESQVPDGPTAARMLRAMIAKGREPAAPAVATAPPAPPPTPAPKPSPAKAAPVPEDEARRAVARMAGGVFKDARRAAWGPPPGRRRMTPAELQRQLAEVRRKYGSSSRRIAQPAEPSRRSITDVGGAYSR